MKDIEIIKLLSDIKPETNKQRDKLQECIRIMGVDKAVDLFLSELSIQDFNSDPEKLYWKYVKWCSVKSIPSVRINDFIIKYNKR